jgi:hypothetical protein
MADIYPQGIGLPTADSQRLLNQSFSQSPIDTTSLRFEPNDLAGSQIKINPDIVAQYSQQVQNTIAPPPPQIEQYRRVQPIPGRQEYYNMVQQRFMEIADMVGGMDVLARTKRIDAARNAAMEDVANIYGPPPVIQQQMQVQQIPGTNRVVVTGGGFTAPQVIETNQQQADGVQLKPVVDPQGKPIPGTFMTPGGDIKTFKTQAETEAEGFRLSDILNDAVKSIDALIGEPPPADPRKDTPDAQARRLRKENNIKWAAGTSGDFLSAISPFWKTETSGIQTDIQNLASKIQAVGATIFAGQGSFSDQERQTIKDALSSINLGGTDEQAVASLRGLQQRLYEIKQRANKPKSDAAQGSAPSSPPVQEGYTREVWSGNKRTPAQ